MAELGHCMGLFSTTVYGIGKYVIHGHPVGFYVMILGIFMIGVAALLSVLLVNKKNISK